MITLEISTHSGAIDTVDVKDYNPQDLIATINDNSVHSVLIGDNIYSRIDIKNVKPIKEEVR